MSSLSPASWSASARMGMAEKSQMYMLSAHGGRGAAVGIEDHSSKGIAKDIAEELSIGNRIGHNRVRSSRPCRLPRTRAPRRRNRRRCPRRRSDSRPRHRVRTKVQRTIPGSTAERIGVRWLWHCHPRIARRRRGLAAGWEKPNLCGISSRRCSPNRPIWQPMILHQLRGRPRSRIVALDRAI